MQMPKFVFKKKKCKLCKGNIKRADFKDIDFLSRFVTDRGKLLPRRINGCCAKHQRKIKVTVKQARYMALLPYVKVENLKTK